MAGVDYGLLGALRGRDNWSEIKAEKHRELQYQTVMNRMLEDDNRANQERMAAIQQYLQTANTLKVLPKGMERIQALEEELRGPIAEKIKKYGGDIKKFWEVEGPVVMQNYVDGLLNHPTTVREVMNASNAARWQADMQAGLTERQDLDPVTGLPINSFAERMHQYNLGDIDALDYQGAFKQGKISEDFFGKTYGSPNRYKSIPVGAGDYANTMFRQLIESGLSERDARQQAAVLANNYKQHLNTGGTPLRFKSDKWTPPAGWGNEHEQQESVKYIAEAVKKAGSDDADFWTQTEKVGDPNATVDKVTGTMNNVFGFTPQSEIKISTRLKGLPLGDASIPKSDGKGNVSYQTFKNTFDKFYKDKDGNVYYTTSKSLATGEGMLPLTDATIDELALGSKNPAKAAAALRKVLVDMGAYPNQNVKFTQPKEQTTVTVEYIDAEGNDVDLSDATQEDIDAAIDAGLIKPKE